MESLLTLLFWRLSKFNFFPMSPVFSPFSHFYYFLSFKLSNLHFSLEKRIQISSNIDTRFKKHLLKPILPNDYLAPQLWWSLLPVPQAAHLAPDKASGEPRCYWQLEALKNFSSTWRQEERAARKLAEVPVFCGQLAKELDKTDHPKHDLYGLTVRHPPWQKCLLAPDTKFPDHPHTSSCAFIKPLSADKQPDLRAGNPQKSVYVCVPLLASGQVI